MENNPKDNHSYFDGDTIVVWTFNESLDDYVFNDIGSLADFIEEEEE